MASASSGASTGSGGSPGGAAGGAPPGGPTSRDEILRVEDLSKSFGGTRALEDVSLAVGAGEIHALVGQNGSGKSTLIKILSGYHAPDGGAVWVHGERLRLPLPASELRRVGMGFAHQDLGLVETMSIVDNLRLGHYETGFGGRIRWRAERARARELMARFGLRRDPRTPVRALTQTERAILGVARALDEVERHAGHGLLVLDEPTASLPDAEVRLLFEAMRHVSESGSAVMFVTHRLEEVLAVADSVSVLREGRHVLTRPAAGLDAQRLVEAILGRELEALYPDVEHATAEPLLTVTGLGGTDVVDVSFELRRGEILGLTGLLGAGHDEVPYLVTGAEQPASGVVRYRGRTHSSLSPRTATRSGIALLPADRKRQSGLPRATVKENVTMPSLRRFRRFGRLDHRRERREVRRVLEAFGVRPPEPDIPLGSLSGGNQQKALLARWIERRPAVLLLHEPTQGVDVGSKREIFELLRDTVRAGTSVLYASAEYEDLAHLCDRVLVLRRGRIADELAGPSLTRDAIVASCFHGDRSTGPPRGPAAPSAGAR